MYMYLAKTCLKVMVCFGYGIGEEELPRVDQQVTNRLLTHYRQTILKVGGT